MARQEAAPQRTKRRVVILGGGFGGLYAARQLERTLAKRSDIEVVLISRDNYLLFTPMLHEVAAGDLSPTDIVNPLCKMLRRVRLIEGEVSKIDLQSRARGPQRCCLRIIEWCANFVCAGNFRESDVIPRRTHKDAHS